MTDLWLATVVVEFRPVREAGQEARDTSWIAETLMADPAVVTVRTDGGDLRWLYRKDVETPARDSAALSAAELVVAHSGWTFDVAELSWMSERERRAFHRRFDAKSHAPTTRSRGQQGGQWGVIDLAG